MAKKQTKKPIKKASRKPKSDTKTKTKATTRKIAQPSYKSFRLHKKIRPDTNSLPKARKLLRAALGHVGANKRLFLGIIAVQIVFTLIFVTGFSIFEGRLQETRDITEEVFGEQSALVIGTTLLGTLVTSGTGETGEASSLYGLLLLLVSGLAIIWSLRQTHAHEKPKLKDAYYSGMYPIIPFLLVLLVILLQLIPLIIGNTIYGLVVSSGIAVTGLEQFIWLLVFIGLGLLSLYMITSSIFALYIVTLPNVTPMQALRSARQLVLHRRMLVVRKILFLPVVLFIAAVAIMLPLIIYVTPVAEPVFFVLGNIGILLAHAYMYELYRKLL